MPSPKLNGAALAVRGARTANAVPPRENTIGALVDLDVAADLRVGVEAERDAHAVLPQERDRASGLRRDLAAVDDEGVGRAVRLDEADLGVNASYEALAFPGPATATAEPTSSAAEMPTAAIPNVSSLLAR